MKEYISANAAFQEANNAANSVPGIQTRRNNTEKAAYMAQQKINGDFYSVGRRAMGSQYDNRVVRPAPLTGAPSASGGSVPNPSVISTPLLDEVKDKFPDVSAIARPIAKPTSSPHKTIEDISNMVKLEGMVNTAPKASDTRINPSDQEAAAMKKLLSEVAEDVQHKIGDRVNNGTTVMFRDVAMIERDILVKKPVGDITKSIHEVISALETLALREAGDKAADLKAPLQAAVKLSEEKVMTAGAPLAK